MKRKKFFYTPRYAKPSDVHIMQLLTTSLLGIVVCMACLMGITWAWFSDSGVQNNATSLKAANFTAAVEVKQDSSSVISPTGGNSWTLSKGEYSVTITPGGTSQIGGYCAVKLGENTYYTEQIAPLTAGARAAQTSVEFKVTVNDGNVTLTVTPHWGTAPTGEDAKPIPSEGITVGTPATEPSTEPSSEPIPVGDPSGGGSQEAPGFEDELNADGTYTVKAGDTLSAIADKFHTTVEKLMAYNGITNPDDIKIGQHLKVQSEGNEAPEASSPTEPEETLPSPSEESGVTEPSGPSETEPSEQNPD